MHRLMKGEGKEIWPLRNGAGMPPEAETQDAYGAQQATDG